MEKKVIKTDYFTLVIQDGKANLTTDYNPEVVTAARRLNGKWQAYQKVWQFDSRDEDRIKTFLKEIFGTDGEAPADLVDVKIYFKKLPSQAFEYNYGASAFALGRQIAHRPRRDAKVRLGNNVSILAGGFPSSGGSAKNPRLSAEDGTILLVRDVPRTVLEKDEMACNDCYEIVNDPNPPKSAPIKPEAPAPDNAADVYAYYPADLIQKVIDYYVNHPKPDWRLGKEFAISYLRSNIKRGANQLAKVLRYVENADSQTFLEYITGKSGLVSLKDRGEAFKEYYGIDISKAATQEEIIPILKQQTPPRQTIIPSAPDTPSPFLDIMERMASRMPMLATISGWQETADRIKKGDTYQVLGTNLLNELLLIRVVPVITDISIDLDITQLREAYTYALEPYGDKGDYAIIRRTLDEAVEARRQALYQRSETIRDLTAQAYQLWSETRTVAQNKHRQFGIRIPFQDLEAVLPRPKESQGLEVLRLAEAQHDQVRGLDSDTAFMAYFTKLGYKPPVRDEQEPDTQPGDYFVSVIQDIRDPQSPRKMLLGPFQTHQEALDKVEYVKEYTRDKYQDSAFYAFGTARAEVGSGIKGALNEQMGFGALGIEKQEKEAEKKNTEKATQRSVSLLVKGETLSESALSQIKNALIQDNELRFSQVIKRETFEEIRKIMDRLGAKWKSAGRADASGLPKGKYVFPDYLDANVIIKSIVESGVMPAAKPAEYIQIDQEAVVDDADLEELSGITSYLRRPGSVRDIGSLEALIENVTDLSSGGQRITTTRPLSSQERFIFDLVPEIAPDVSVAAWLDSPDIAPDADLLISQLREAAASMSPYQAYQMLGREIKKYPYLTGPAVYTFGLASDIEIGQAAYRLMEIKIQPAGRVRLMMDQLSTLMQSA